MQVYLDFLRKELPKENFKFIRPNPRSIPPKIYKNFIYPFKIPKGYDLYHILDHSYGHLAYFIPSKKLIMTCHDVIPLKFPDKFSFRARALFNFYLSGLKKASKIIVGSKSTANDLKEIIRNPDMTIIPPISVNKIVNSPDRKRIREEFGVNEKVVLLSVGSLFYKNTELILKALDKLILKCPGIVLIKVGSFQKSEEKIINDRKLSERIIQLKEISDEKLNEIYFASDILVFPSIYEGFGIPPLEAMARGLPVITSSKSSLPEVVADAAIKLNSENVDELVEAILNLIKSNKKRKSLILKGYKNLSRFESKKIIKDLKGAYSEVYSRNVRNKRI
jgi:glycosyltransferase involved in cell wall biosynthesis